MSLALSYPFPQSCSLGTRAMPDTLGSLQECGWVVKRETVFLT